MKKIYLLIIISLLLFGCEKEFKTNDTITIKGTVNTEEIIDNGTYHRITILELQEPIIIEGTEINKIELNTEEVLDNEEVEVTGILEDTSTSGLSYSLKVK